jgi:CheY-like chemotaxis protein
MAAKRALIVDDSRSARLILERILVKHAIDVDSAESAEAAIEYLAANRPDVIFMDHMMPGMDGLQAVAAIKNNPRTATIPIMMYTSQAGELYLGQARALGAVGVLPKQIKPADVSKVLQQLHLAQDREPMVQIVQEAVPDPQDEPTPLVATRPLTDSTLREHFAELRRALIASADTQTDRIGAELRAVLRETGGAGASSLSWGTVPWPWVVAACALVLALVLGALRVGDARRVADLSAQVAELQGRMTRQAPGPAAASVREERPAPADDPPAAQPAPRPVAGPAPRAVPASDLRPLNLPVPFGAETLGGGRLESIRQFLDRLARDGVSGVVDIKTYAGRFCLAGNAMDGFSLAPEDMAYAKCDVVGNPTDDLSPAQRVPLALANLVAEVRHSTRGALDVQVSVGDASVMLVPYPTVASDLTAGEWNRAGSSNNRVEVRVR